MQTRIVRKPVIVKSRKGNYYKKYNNYVREELCRDGQWKEIPSLETPSLTIIPLLLGVIGSLALMHWIL